MGYAAATMPHFVRRGGWHAVPVVRGWLQGRTARAAGPAPARSSAREVRGELRRGTRRLFTGGYIGYRMLRRARIYRGKWNDPPVMLLAGRTGGAGRTGT